MAALTLPPRRRAVGFTLVELLTVVTIIGVLAALAVPSLRQLYLTQQVRGAAADLQSAFYFARSEAVKRAADIQVIPTSSAWTQGWTVQLASGGTVLRRQSTLSDQLSATSGSTVTYRSDGHASGAFNIAFKTANTSIPARCVVIDLSGRPAVVYDTDGNAANGCN